MPDMFKFNSKDIKKVASFDSDIESEVMDLKKAIYSGESKLLEKIMKARENSNAMRSMVAASISLFDRWVDYQNCSSEEYEKRYPDYDKDDECAHLVSMAKELTSTSTEDWKIERDSLNTIARLCRRGLRQYQSGKNIELRIELSEDDMKRMFIELEMIDSMRKKLDVDQTG